MTQKFPLSVEIVEPRVTALKYTVRFGRFAAVFGGLFFLLLAGYAFVSGESALLIAVLLFGVVAVFFVVWLATELCELLYDTLVPK